MKGIILFFAFTPGVSFASVSQDFEQGSGGLKAEWLAIGAEGLIFLAMVVLVLWVLQSSMKQLAQTEDGEGYSVFSLICRSVFLCVLVVLVLT